MKEFPRRFVPTSADMADWAALSVLFDDLDRRPVADRDALVRWLADWDELSAAVDEEGTRRHIEMTLHTDDPEKEKRQHFDRGNQYAAEKKDEFAIVEYTSAVKIDPKFGEAWSKLAETY